MNTLYFTYALEVEKTASITQAADNLFMTQPTLSKAIKDLEANVGFAIFRRTSRGVVPTKQGEVFLAHARKIAAQLDRMELDFRTQEAGDQVFSVAIPHDGQLSQAAARFLCSFDSRREMELEIRESGPREIIESVAEGRFVLGILRLRRDREVYYMKLLREKRLQHQLLRETYDVPLMSRRHPLAEAPQLDAEALSPYIEIAFGDEELPNRTPSTRRILVNDRSVAMNLLRTNPLAYMWSPILPPSTLRHHGLIQHLPSSRPCRDLLISRAGYKLSDLDRAFLKELEK